MKLLLIIAVVGIVVNVAFGHWLKCWWDEYGHDMPEWYDEEDSQGAFIKDE